MPVLPTADAGGGNDSAILSIGLSGRLTDRVSIVVVFLLLNQMKNKLSDIRITIVFGAWCGDSKEQVPRFLKVLDFLKYNVDYISLIAVDRSKTAGDVPTADLKIEKVPTFIMMREGREIGRIVETPAVTLEKDLLDIISKK